MAFPFFLLPPHFHSLVFNLFPLTLRRLTLALRKEPVPPVLPRGLSWSPRVGDGLADEEASPDPAHAAAESVHFLREGLANEEGLATPCACRLFPCDETLPLQRLVNAPAGCSLAAARAFSEGVMDPVRFPYPGFHDRCATHSGTSDTHTRVETARSPYYISH